MPWLPHFLNPWTAVAAAGVAVPALLVLYFLKLRRREMAVSSTLLWRKAIRDLQVNAPFQKLRRNLLLLLQLLLLALLLFALARPVSQHTQVAKRTTVVLIDRSASMSATDGDGGAAHGGGRTRLDEAKARAKSLVGTLGRGDNAMVIAFDDSAETVQGFTTDVPALKRAIDGIRPTDRRSRLKLAYQLAEAQTANFNPEQNRSISDKPLVQVFSDGRVLDSDLSIRADLRFDAVGSDGTPNVGIVAMSARRNYERPTEVQVFARLANFGPNPLKPDVELSVDGQARKLASTALAPERWGDRAWADAHPGGRDETFVAKDSVEFTIDLTEAAVVRVEVKGLDADALASDNAATVIVPPPKALSVLLVTDGNYFLERALASLNLRHPDTAPPEAYERDKPAKYDVILFDRHAPKYLPAAGSFVYFGCAPDGAHVRALVDAESNLPQTVTEEGVLDWQRDHPILRFLALNKLYVAEAIKLDVPKEAVTLIEGLKTPLLVLDRQGPRTHLVVTFDVLQSNWPLKQSFPVFMHNMLQFLAVGSEMDVRPSLSPGDTPRIPRANLQRAAVPGGDAPKSITLDGPAGRRRIDVPPEGDFALPALELAGVYTTDPPIPQFERVAVNLLDENESNLVPATKAPGGVGETIAQTGGKSRLELWWWVVACAALPMLMIEWWVYTRRVHL